MSVIHDASDCPWDHVIQAQQEEAGRTQPQTTDIENLGLVFADPAASLCALNNGFLPKQVVKIGYGNLPNPALVDTVAHDILGSSSTPPNKQTILGYNELNKNLQEMCEKECEDFLGKARNNSTQDFLTLYDKLYTVFRHTPGSINFDLFYRTNERLVNMLIPVTQDLEILRRMDNCLSWLIENTFGTDGASIEKKKIFKIKQQMNCNAHIRLSSEQQQKNIAGLHY